MFISKWLSGCAVLESQIHYRGRSGWVRLASTKDFKRALVKMKRVKKQYPRFEYSDVNRYQSTRLEVQDRISVGTNLTLRTMTHPEIGFQNYTPIILTKGVSFETNKTDQKRILITGIYTWLVIRQLDGWLLYHLGAVQLVEITVHRIRNQALAIVCSFTSMRGLTAQDVAARLHNQFFGHERLTVFAEEKRPNPVDRGPTIAIGSQRLPPRWAHILCTWSEWRLFEPCSVQPLSGW
ncbi:hypothetical protein QL093DRAFT_2527268 [Fusarium oxysporum]|nr:hypothetical protein FOWG_16644 [Fusarium oxysporum f. sp. lycopersici MN25]KAJ9413048.1 hypothetical protein QL093DRAFT_2527268 [Fusarium oxysporum]